jgi:hypothetical protein
MSGFLDETFEEEQSRERREHFYGDFSSEVRKKLLSKNIKRPDNLYDVLYTPVRKELLSKNVPNLNLNIDNAAKEIRNDLLSKQVEKDINLDASGQNIREGLLSKNKLLETSIELEKTAEAVRKGLISKNVSNENANPTTGSDDARKNLSSKNQPKNTDLDATSSEIRDSLLSKNDSKNSSLDKTSQEPRNSLLSKNQPKQEDLDRASGAYRNELLSKNVSKQTDLDATSSDIRDGLISKNVSDSKDIDRIADNARQDLLSSNKSDTTNLDKSSEEFRTNLESKNKPSDTNIDSVSTGIRNDLLSKNDDVESTLDSDSQKVRADLLSKNNPISHNIDSESDKIRKDLLSKNDKTSGNLDRDSEQFRTSLLSSNKPSTANPENGADEVRGDLLSSNTPKKTDLEQASQDVRGDLLSSNVPTGANPENGAIEIRTQLFANNVPNGANPEDGSEEIRNDLLSNNVPNGASPEIGAQSVRNDLLSSNVPNGASPENGADDIRDELLSSNVPNGASPENGDDDIRNDLLSSNVPSGFNPEIGADEVRDDLLASNISSGANPEDGADEIRNDLLSSNVPNGASPENGANDIRNELLSSNVPTSTNIETAASQARGDLLSKNVPKNIDLDANSNPFRHRLLSKNGGPNTLGANIILPNGTSQFIGISNLEILGAITRQSNKLKDKIFATDIGGKLLSIYGTEVSPDGFTPVATITSAAQLHNIESNTFALHRYSQGGSGGFEALTNHNADKFQELLRNTVGGLRKVVQVGTNTTPSNVIQENQGQYLPLGNQGIEALLKPEGSGELGTAQSMMSQTEPSDAIEKSFYRTTQERGVRNIINTIKKSNITLAKNYDSQKSKSFIIGVGNDKGKKKASTRFTVENPYRAPAETGVLELRITNYAINNGNVKTMSFPPYVKSFNNSDSASWNETLFLGRPEPIYTYSNSKREGSLEFMILTDYSQEVDIGIDYSQENFYSDDVIKETFDKHFTDGISKTAEKKKLQAEIANRKKKITKLNLQKSQNSGDADDVGGKANLDREISDEQKAMNALQAQLDELNSSKDMGADRLYAEGTTEAGNIYQSEIDGSKITENGDISRGPTDTKLRLDKMKKDLLFQPAFFSGDKVDFLNRVEFISKMTRPSRNTSADGFSFTNPPVCHIHLGDWVNHDVIINSVSYDYSDAPWTFDKGRVQPMWVSVQISFNIIGSYGANTTENVPLATDIGGFFQKRVSS